MSDEFGDLAALPPLPDDDAVVESGVSVHEQDNPENFSQLGEANWISFYCFTDYIEAIPLTADIAGGDLDGDQLMDFPETPAIINYAMLYCLDCISELHARAVFDEIEPVALDPETVTDEEIVARKAVLSDLLQEPAMCCIYLLVGPENQDYFFDLFQRYGANGWGKIEVMEPPGDVDPTSIDEQIAANLNDDVFYTIVTGSPMDGTGVYSPIRLPAAITEIETQWLEEFVSFNHIRDVGNDGPPPDDAPVTPPVPIFPVDSIDITLGSLALPAIQDRLAYATDGDNTELFEFLEPGFWVHQETGIFTIPYGNCWVDQNHRFYRMYADNVAAPNTIYFFRLDDDFDDVPPQAQAFAMRTGFNIGDIGPVWGQYEVATIAVFG